MQPNVGVFASFDRSKSFFLSYPVSFNLSPPVGRTFHISILPSCSGRSITEWAYKGYLGANGIESVDLRYDSPESISYPGATTSFLHDGNDFSSSIRSYLASKSHNVDVRTDTEEAYRLFRHAVQIYENAKRIINKLDIGRAYIFNGRYFSSRAIAFAAEKSGCQLHFYEWDKTRSRFYLFDTWVHDYDSMSKRVSTEFVPKSFRVFKNYRSDEQYDGFKFSAGNNKLFERPDDGLVVSFFTSSEDEYASLRDDPNYLFESQYGCVKWLDRFLMNQPRITLVVRVHPHISVKHSQQRSKWDGMALESGGIVIRSTDNVSSYSILEQSDLVLTYGSSIGYEAVLKGIRTLCLAKIGHWKGFYPYREITREEFEDFLNNPEVVKKTPEANVYSYENYRCRPGHVLFPFYLKSGMPGIKVGWRGWLLSFIALIVIFKSHVSVSNLSLFVKRLIQNESE